MTRADYDIPQDVPADDDAAVAWGDQLTWQERGQEVGASTFSARTSYVSALEAVSLMGYDPDRSRSVVRNLDTVYGLVIGPFSSVSSGQGFTLRPGAELLVETQGEIYARAGTDAAGVPAPGMIAVSLWIESNR